MIFQFISRIVDLSETPFSEFDNFEIMISAEDYLKELFILMEGTPVRIEINSASSLAPSLRLSSATAKRGRDLFRYRTLHNYMMWRMIISKAPYLSADFTLLVDKINSGVLGNYQALPRWKVCLNEGESPSHKSQLMTHHKL